MMDLSPLDQGFAFQEQGFQVAGDVLGHRVRCRGRSGCRTAIQRAARNLLHGEVIQQHPGVRLTSVYAGGVVSGVTGFLLPRRSRGAAHSTIVGARSHGGRRLGDLPCVEQSLEGVRERDEQFRGRALDSEVVRGLIGEAPRSASPRTHGRDPPTRGVHEAGLRRRGSPRGGSTPGCGRRRVRVVARFAGKPV